MDNQQKIITRLSFCYKSKKEDIAVDKNDMYSSETD